MAGFMLLWTGAWWLPVAFLLAPALPGAWTAPAALAAVALAPILPLVRAFAGDRYPSAATRIWVFRPFWYLQLIMPLVAVAGLAGALVGLPFGAGAHAGRLALAVAALVLALAAVYGYAETRRLTVRTLELAYTDLPEGLDGLRIAQVSDLHTGPQTPRAFLARIAGEVTGTGADLVVFTGDQVDDFPEDVVHFTDAFGHLAAPLGVYAIAGNHDVYAGWAPVRAGMERAGMTVLVNEAVRLERGGDTLWLAGTGDPAGRSAAFAGPGGPAPDVEGTLAAVPAEAFTVVLAHNPAVWPELAKRGVHLTLSGHTHYGQLYLPWLRWSVASPFLELAFGMHRRGRSVLYINPGTNYWGIPFRIGTPPEVTVIILGRRPHGGAQPEKEHP